MARIAIDAALGSGFGLIRRQPGAVLLWGLVYLALGAASFAFFGSFYLSLFAQIAANARAGDAASPLAMNALAPQIMAMQGWSWLLSLLAVFVGVTLYCAVFRAILHPAQRRFGYLRVGATELLLFVLAIAAYIVSVVAALIGAVVVALVVAALVAMHAVAAGVALAVLAAMAALIAIVWIALRFSMVGPMMVADGRFHLFESWTLTRGHAGVLFILAICLVAILLVAEAAVFGALALVGVAVVAPALGGLANLATVLARSPSAVVAAFAPFLVVVAIILIPLSGCVRAIMAAPWARAYLDLTGPDAAALAA
jgi:hypothetical protein